MKRLPRHTLAICVIAMLLVNQLKGQSTCTALKSDSLFVPDSIVLIPGSIRLNDDYLQPNDYLITDGFIILKHVDGSEKTICYNYLIRKKSLVGSEIASGLYDSTALFHTQKAKNRQYSNTADLLGLNGIEIDGAFMRSVSGGQNTGAFMHAAMDLQLSGALSKELMLKARLTDQQLPFEPEGNTQRLQDFDRINIQLLHKNWALEGGDIDIRSAESLSFLRYNRLVQGIGISTPVLSLDSTKSSSTSLITSISRSKVGTQQIKPIEGVLGPYRIEGPANEAFIFVIAGSERIFLNGKLLTRGLANDYVIDYNAAEITFNSNIYISKYHQILIEFEYSDQQFGRNVVAFEHQQQFKKFKVSAGYFQESDNINNAITDLTQQEMLQLAETPAHLGYGYIDAVDTVPYQINKVLYARQDTTVKDITYSFYRYSTDQESAIYQVSFSYVGEGAGDYIRDNINTNKSVYEWIAPVDGISQGNYNPVRKIALPQQRKIFNLGLSYALNKHEQLSVNYAGSSATANRFNPQSSEIKGNAIEMAMSGNRTFNKLKLNYKASVELVDSAFNPIQNFRALDFNREWGLNQAGQYLNAATNLLKTNLAIQYDKHIVKYDMAYLKLNGAEAISGQQNELSYQHIGQLNLKTRLFRMRSNQLQQVNGWDKWYGDLSYEKWLFTPGYKFAYEKHQQLINDSISNSFQNYQSHEAYLTTHDSLPWNLRLSHEFRQDFTPQGGIFEFFEASQTTNLDYTHRYNRGGKFNLNFIRRAIEGKRDEQVPANNNFYQGALGWSAHFWQHNITQELYYQTGTGRVLERDYFFQEVALGLGTHSWADLNNNDEKELEEFFEDQTLYGDKNFVKVFNFSNSYRTAYINNFRYLLRFKMPGNWNSSAFTLAALSRLSGQFQVNIENRNTFSDWADRINPISLNNAEQLLSAKEFMKTTLFVNRGRRLNTTFNWLNTNRKQLLLNGFESNLSKLFTNQSSFNVSKDWDVLLGYERGTHNSASDLLEARNYTYFSQGILPGLVWQHFKNWRIKLGYEKSLKTTSQVEQRGETHAVDFQKFDLNSKWLKDTNTMVEATVAYIRLESDLPDEQTPLAFEMFEGLRTGENMVWNVNFRRKIFDGLNLNLAYNGRKTSGNRAVQFGSVQLSALF